MDDEVEQSEQVVIAPELNQGTASQKEVVKGDLKPETGDLPEKMQQLSNFMWAVVLALFLGFGATFVSAAAMLVQAWGDKTATYQNLVNQVTAQNENVKMLIQLQQNSNYAASMKFAESGKVPNSANASQSTSTFVVPSTTGK